MNRFALLLAATVLLGAGCSSERSVVEPPTAQPAGPAILTGRVHDSRGQAISGVTVRATGSPIQTDDEGAFLIVDVPSPGPLTLELDGTTAVVAGRRFASLVVHLELAESQVHSLDRILTLPDLEDVAGATQVVEVDAEGHATEPIELRNAEGTVLLTGATGTRIGSDVPSGSLAELAVQPVSVGGLPVPLPDELLAVGALFVSPSDALFSPGLDMRMPNLLELPVATVVELHVLEGESGLWQRLDVDASVREVEASSFIAAEGSVERGGFLAAALRQAVDCTTTVVGRVVNDESELGAPGVLVSLDTGESVTSDLDGSFRIEGVPAYEVAAFELGGQCVARPIDFELLTPPHMGSILLEGQLASNAIVLGGVTELEQIALDLPSTGSVAGLLTGDVDITRSVHFEPLGNGTPADVFPTTDGSFVVSDLLAGGYVASYLFPGDTGVSERLLEVGPAFVTSIFLEPGGSVDSGDPVPPTNLAYVDPTPTYVLGAPIEPNTASVEGEVAQFSVAPPLSGGLTFDSVSGTISGTPTAVAGPTLHRVVATSSVGSTFAELEIEVTASTLSIADLEADEGSTGTTTVTFEVTLTPPASVPVRVDFRTEEGTASEGVDYFDVAEQLVILPGDTLALVEVAVVADTLREEDETFLGRLSNAFGAQLADDVGIARIRNDDAPSAPVLAFAGSQLKTLDFSWPAVPGALSYRLLFDPDGLSGFDPALPDLPGSATSAQVEVPVHLTDWIKAVYRLEACNEFGCNASFPVGVLEGMIPAIGALRSDFPDFGDHFGNSVSVSGDGTTLAVGAPSEDSAATGIDGDPANNDAVQSGAVYVYRRSGQEWELEAYVKPRNTGGSDFFGATVALSADGSTLAVSAAGEDSSASGVGGDPFNNDLSGSGAAYVYARTGSTWSEQAYLKASNPDAFDAFGAALALSRDGSTLAVGATGEDSPATGVDGDQGDDGEIVSMGASYVFARTGDAWAQEAYVKASNTGGQDVFGSRVALSDDGDTLAVSAMDEDSAATGIDGNAFDNSASASGAVYVYRRSGSTWTHEAYVKASNTGAADFFGSSLDLSGGGDTLVVGAFSEDSDEVGVVGTGQNDLSSNAGAAYVYRREGSVWAFEAFLKSFNTDSQDQFGGSLALSRDGNLLVVGAGVEDGATAGIDGDLQDNQLFNAGAAYVYRRTGTAWSTETYVKSPLPAAAAFLGDTVTSQGTGTAISLDDSGDTLVIGAVGEDAGGFLGDANSKGAVYTY